MKYLDEFRNPAAAAVLHRDILKLSAALRVQDRQAAIMEVCGTHTMAIARGGIRDLLPPEVRLVSGPGCPVCVTEPGYIDAAVKLVRQGVIVCSFGDMIRVPGSETSLEACRAEGGDVRICYSPLEALKIAAAEAGREVVFLAIGFETTIGPALGLLAEAQRLQLKNLSILTAFKTVPQALAVLSQSAKVKIDAFLLPAHVSAVIGVKKYAFLVERFGKPGVIAGFEPLDILLALKEILTQLASGRPALINQYSRVVREHGNTKILDLFEHYLEPIDGRWRGLGIIPQSGLGLKSEFSNWNAEYRFSISTSGGKSHPGCRCGEVLEGALQPPQCPLFGKACTPRNPVGPCMVSAEGTCSAYYKYVKRV